MTGAWEAAAAPALGALTGSWPSATGWLWGAAWVVGLTALASWSWRRLLALVWALGMDPRRRLAWSVPVVRAALVVVAAGAIVRGALSGGEGALVSLSLAVAASVFAWRQGQDALAGVSLAFRRPFALGDEIGVGDVMGRVDEIGLTAVRVRGPGGATVEVPARKLVAGPLRCPGPGRRALPVAVEVPLGAGLPTDQALERLRAHALCSPYVDARGPVAVEVLDGARARCVAVPVQPDEADELRSDLVARAQELAAQGAPGEASPSSPGR